MASPATDVPRETPALRDAWIRRLAPANRDEDRRRMLEKVDPRLRELVEAWERR